MRANNSKVLRKKTNNVKIGRVRIYRQLNKWNQPNWSSRSEKKLIIICSLTVNDHDVSIRYLVLISCCYCDHTSIYGFCSISPSENSDFVRSSTCVIEISLCEFKSTFSSYNYSVDIELLVVWFLPIPLSAGTNSYDTRAVRFDVLENITFHLVSKRLVFFSF